MNNIILNTDSYKLTHWGIYPEGTTGVYSYFEARNGAKYPGTVFYGLQYLLKKHLTGRVVTAEKIDEAQRIIDIHMGPGKFNRAGWMRIANKHGGKLPLRIKAVPEGAVIPVSNVMMTVENTDPQLPWLTNYMESLLTHIWAPCTVATMSHELRKKCVSSLVRTSDGDANAIAAFMLHDFGYRGVTSNESAGICGSAHLLSFLGTDTVPALQCAETNYDADLKSLGFSVVATEHSNMTSLGEKGEFSILEKYVDDNPDGIMACVSDSYNIERFVNEYVRSLKDKILARKPNAMGLCKFVVRPDSLRWADDTPEDQMVWLTDKLADIFGTTTNSKGFKVLHPKIGLLWGDGIEPAGINLILRRIEAAGYSTKHLVFGMGGGLLQKINRDVQRFAFKCAAQERNGVWEDVQKNPLDVTKKSKAGRMKLTLNPDSVEFQTVREDVLGVDLLQTVFEDGRLVADHSFEDIRETLAYHIN